MTSPYAKPLVLHHDAADRNSRVKGSEGQSRPSSSTDFGGPFIKINKLQCDEIFQTIKHIYQAKFIFGDSLEDLDENFKQDKAGDLHVEEVPGISDPSNNQNVSAIAERLRVAEGIIRKLYARSIDLTQENRKLRLEISRLRESITPCQVLVADNQDSTSSQGVHENPASYPSTPTDMQSVRTHPFNDNNILERDGATSAPPNQSWPSVASTYVIPQRANLAAANKFRNFPSSGEQDDLRQSMEEQSLNEMIAGISLLGYDGQSLVEELRESKKVEALLRRQLQAHFQQARELASVEVPDAVNSLVGLDREKLMVAREMMRELTDTSYQLQHENASLRQKLATRDELARSRYVKSASLVMGEAGA
jgi:hypothetical protein